MQNNKLKSDIKFYFMLSLISFLLIGVGGFLGWYYPFKKFRKRIISNSQTETLGKFINAPQKKAIANVYYNPSQAIQEMDNYSWAAPTVISPFVGNGCRPGRHNNTVINSMQFRSEQELSIPKPSKSYRIFLTGGSTAFSSGAPSQDRTISAYLSRILNGRLTPNTSMNYEVFTMAAPSWASTHERIIIENRLSELEPDMVISLSGNNDVHWGVKGRNIFWFKSHADEFYWRLVNAIYRYAGFGKMPNVVQNQETPVDPSVVANRLGKNVKLNSYVLSLNNIHYVFCLQPTLPVTKKVLTARETQIIAGQRPAHWKEYFIESYKNIDTCLAHIRMDNFIYFNISDVFDNKSSDEEIFLDSFHFGDKGNEIIAERIYLCIKDKVLGRF